EPRPTAVAETVKVAKDMTARARSLTGFSAMLFSFAVGHAASRPSAEPRTQASPSPATESTVRSEGFYTVDQAARGRRLFNQWCASCHTLTGTTQLATGRGIWLGSKRLLINVGDPAARNYPSVYHLFRRVRDSMPAFDVDALSVSAKVDIVAYLLEQS